MTSRLRRWLLAAVAVTALTTVATSTLASADTTPTENSAAPFAIEDGTYPDAAAILAATGATLIRGDGHITYTPCESAHQIAVWARSITLPVHRICFAATSPTGYLALNVTDAFRIETAGRAINASLSTNGEPQSVDVPMDTAVAVGESASTSNRSILLELHVTS